MEGTPYFRFMRKQVEQDQATRAARQAGFIDGLPVVTLGAVALAWVGLRAFRRADEYLRRIQLESMAIAFVAVLIGFAVATVLDSADVIELRQLTQPILIGGVAIWLVIADLRTRFR